MYLVSAGFSFPRFVHELDKLGFFTAHWIGIPGTVGGAIAVNASPGNGGSIGDDTISVLIFDIDSQTFIEVDNAWFVFEYRNTAIKSGKKKAIIWSAIIKMHKKDLVPQDIRNRYESHMQSKEIFQKGLEGANAGCFFKNPCNASTGKLIDDAGLKGMIIGNAMISQKHGNFIINTKNASSKDILDIAKYIKKVIFDKYNIKLEEEVVIVEY